MKKSLHKLLIICIGLLGIFACWRLVITSFEVRAGMPDWPDRGERRQLANTMFSVAVAPDAFGIDSPNNHGSIITLDGLGNIFDIVVARKFPEFDNVVFEEYLHSDVSRSKTIAAVRKSLLRLSGYHERFDVLVIEPDGVEKYFFTCGSGTCEVGPVQWSQDDETLAFSYRIDHDLFLGVVNAQGEMRSIALRTVGGWSMSEYLLGWKSDIDVFLFRPGRDKELDSIIHINTMTGEHDVRCTDTSANSWRILRGMCDGTDVRKVFGIIEGEFDRAWLSSDGRYSFSRESKEALLYTRWIEGTNLETGEKFLVKKLKSIFPYLP